MKLKLKTKYSQRDSRWSNIILGFNQTSSQYTIGGYGCLITALCNYLNATGDNETPATINTKLKDGNGYVANSGLLIWDKFAKLFDESYTYTSPWYADPLTDDVLDKMCDLLNDGYPLLTEIDFDPMIDGEQMHWVLIIGYDDKGLIMHDPWTGQEGYVDIYGDPRKSIYHYKVLSKKLSKITESEIICGEQEIPYDDFEGNRHNYDWYPYEWAIEKRKNIEAEKIIKGKNEIIEQYVEQINTFKSSEVTYKERIDTLKNSEERFREAYTSSQDDFNTYKRQTEDKIKTLNKNLEDAMIKLTRASKKLEDMTIWDFIVTKLRGGV